MQEVDAEDILNKKTPVIVAGRGHTVKLTAGQIVIQRTLGVGGQGSAFLVGSEPKSSPPTPKTTGTLSPVEPSMVL